MDLDAFIIDNIDDMLNFDAELGMVSKSSSNEDHFSSGFMLQKRSFREEYLKTFPDGSGTGWGQDAWNIVFRRCGRAMPYHWHVKYINLLLDDVNPRIIHLSSKRFRAFKRSMSFFCLRTKI